MASRALKRWRDKREADSQLGGVLKRVEVMTIPQILAWVDTTAVVLGHLSANLEECASIEARHDTIAQASMSADTLQILMAEARRRVERQLYQKGSTPG